MSFYWVGRLGYRYGRRSRIGFQLDPVYPQRQLILYLVVTRAREANPARLSQAPYPGSDVDPVTVDPFSLDDHVTEVDANTELHPARSRQISIFALELLLDGNGSLHGINDAGKLR